MSTLTPSKNSISFEVESGTPVSRTPTTIQKKLKEREEALGKKRNLSLEDLTQKLDTAANRKKVGARRCDFFARQGEAGSGREAWRSILAGKGVNAIYCTHGRRSIPCPLKY